MIRISLSIGYGRLHLVSSARYIAQAGCAVKLICGWVPKSPNGNVVRMCSWLIGRDLSSGLKKRQVCLPGVNLRSMSAIDFVDQWARLSCRILHVSYKRIEAFSWALFGFFSRRHLKSAEIFHCRSGAGRGGAIRFAKRNGIKVVVDHSALHPARSELNLRDDYARWSLEIAISPRVGVWKNVELDCREADIVLVNAGHIRDSFIEKGYPPEKIRVVHLGVRQDFFGLKKVYEVGERIRILYTGNFSILKGAEYTLRAIALLSKKNLDVQLDVYGSVDIPKKLRQRYAELNVVYHGPVPQEDLKNALACSDIYLFPSLADGCAQSGMEALAAGLPVVATCQSGLPITDGETGCVVPMKDPLAIADKIEWLNRHDADRERIGRAAARLIRENYTWDKYAENVKKVYEELLAE